MRLVDLGVVRRGRGERGERHSGDAIHQHPGLRRKPLADIRRPNRRRAAGRGEQIMPSRPYQVSFRYWMVADPGRAGPRRIQPRAGAWCEERATVYPWWIEQARRHFRPLLVPWTSGARSTRRNCAVLFPADRARCAWRFRTVPQASLRRFTQEERPPGSCRFVTSEAGGRVPVLAGAAEANVKETSRPAKRTREWARGRWPSWRRSTTS